MNYSVTPLFPIPLFYTNIGPLDAIEKSYVVNLEYPDEAAGHDHTADKHILDLPKFANLKDRILNAVYEMIEKEIQPKDVHFELQNSWINRHGKGESNTLHWHSNAMLSGVYYIENEPDAGDIVFQRSHLYYNLFHDTVKVSFNEPTMYNTNEFFITPKAGDLILFPSHLEHMVTPNQTDAPRYSLAFNLFARGTVGGGTSELKL